MHFGKLLSPILLALLASGGAAEAAWNPANSVLLSNVKSLTLRKGLKTTSRRVSPIPQLKCIGGDAKGLYEVDVMRCKNSGADYDDENIQWTCTASLPEEFRLGSTDVICEGYNSPDDPYILKGSCGVEYRLTLTEKGLAKYGKERGGWWGGDGDWDVDTPWGKDSTSTVVAGLFWLLFLGVLFYMIFKGCIVGRGNPREPRTWTGPRFDGGGGGGGGWGGGPPPYDDPPPPYYAPGYNRRKSYGTGGEGWRPGFWSGALGGAAAGYFAGRQGNRQGNRNNNNTMFGGGGSRWNDAGVGPSGTYRSAPSSSSSSPSSTRYESTGFGSTRRR
ncbi:transmembrane protein [Phyllosticta citricarpa]|uniref:Store-operated calcium entry-associated regulatory factor n=2 Tax=Phyllosticta TaxID=121621 RepID=A0ABR1LWC0_9PEZI